MREPPSAFAGQRRFWYHTRMKREQCLVLCLCSCLCLCAATLPESVPAVRKGHPRIFFNSETWPAVKAAAEGPAKADLARLLKRCDAYPADPKCSGTEPAPEGHSSSTPLKPVREWGSQAAECALAWRFTGKKAYLDKAKKMLLSSVAAYGQAYENRRAVTWESTSRILALAAYDWIYEALTDDERRAIIVPFVQYIENVQPGPGKPAIVRRNGGPGGYRAGFYGVDSLLWYSGLAALGDGFCDELARSHLETGYGNCRKMLEFRSGSSGDDGPLVSGTCGYAVGAYPWAHFNFFHSLKAATGLDAAAAYPGLALFPNFVWWNWIQHEKAPLQFGSGDTRHGLNLLGVGNLPEHFVQYAYFFREANPDAARLAATLRQMLPNGSLSQTWPMYPFLLSGAGDVQPFSADELAARSPRARHFESTGQFFMRSGWTPDSTYCMFIAGGKTDAGHRHYDENGFIIYKRGFLALDSGSRALQDDLNLAHYYSQTVAHNCMLIHKSGEPLPPCWGVRSADKSEWLCDGGQTVKAAAKVLAFETNPLFTYIASDAAAAYPGKSDECLRQFLFLADDCFVVYDRVTATQADFGKEWLLHSANEPKIAGDVAEVHAGKGSLFSRTMLPQGAVVEKIGGPGREFWSNGRNWPLNPKFVADREAKAASFGMGPWFGAWRIAVRPPVAAKSDRFLHVINVSDKDDAKPLESVYRGDDREDGCLVRIPGAKIGGKTGILEVAIRFARTGEAGGRIGWRLLDDGGGVLASGARRFAKDVQPQSGVFCKKE